MKENESFSCIFLNSTYNLWSSNLYRLFIYDELDKFDKSFANYCILTFITLMFCLLRQINCGRGPQSENGSGPAPPRDCEQECANGMEARGVSPQW